MASWNLFFVEAGVNGLVEEGFLEGALHAREVVVPAGAKVL